MADFSSYGGVNEEWVAVEATIPPPPPEETLDQMIIRFNGMRDDRSAKEMKAFEDQLTIKTFTIPTRDNSTVEARTYVSSTVNSESSSPLPVFLYFHGGGFVFGTLSSEDATCARIATTVPVVVVNVNYRHTPQFTFPTAWEDSEDALEWIFANASTFNGDPKRVIIGGISAGALLSTAATLGRHLQSKTPQVIGQVLIIPPLVRPVDYDNLRSKLSSPEVSSYVENANAPILPVARIEVFNKLLKYPPGLKSDDYRANPGNATDDQVKGLPPTVFGIAGLDPLRDEGLLFAKQLAENGVPTDVTVFRGVPHGFRGWGDALSASKKHDDVITNGISWILSKPKAIGKFEIKE